MADDFAPVRKVTRRPRQSDPWCDAECRRILTRRLERAAAVLDVAVDAWRAQRRVYRDLRRQKREAFWQSTVEAERSDPRRLWQSIDSLLGCGHPPATEEISAKCFLKYFEEKVASVRALTDNVPGPLHV